MPDDRKPRTSATVIGTVQSVSKEITRGKFTFREVLITEGGRYPNPIVVEWSGDHISKPDVLREGDTCSIACNIRGREWKSPQGEVKHFLSLSGWAIADHDKSGRLDQRTEPAIDDPDADIPF